MSAELGTRNAELQRRPADGSRLPFRVSRGFTLLELTLVLALLVLIGAIVWPALDAPFAAQRLKGAADQLRGDFTKARVTAMNSGRTQLLTFDAAAGRYVFTPVDDGATDAFSASTATLAPTTVPAESRWLPEGVAFQEVASLDDVTPPPATAAVAGFGASPPTAVAGATTSVYFHPDGTTSSARVTLANDRSMFIDIRLRGLTGGVAVGDVLTAAGGVQ